MSNTVTIINIIINVCNHFDSNFDSNICLADGWIESELDANAVQSGVPLSEAGLGLFQLTPGGELPSTWTQAEALNPANNCEIAIPEFIGIFNKFPSATAGEVAFLAQRPQAISATTGQIIEPYPTTPAEAAVTVYAQEVQSVYNSIKAGSPPAGFLAAANTAAGVPLPYPPPVPPKPIEEIPMFVVKNPSNPTAEFLVSGSRRMPLGTETYAQLCTAQNIPTITLTAAEFNLLVEVAWGTF